MAEVEKPIETTELNVTHPDDAEVDTEASALAVDDGKGNKLVPLSALIGAKKELKTLKTKVAELEPVVKRTTEVEQRLNQVQPMIDALVTDPKLRAEALRIVKGTRTSDIRTDQPTPDEDPDAAGYAEDMGFYLADNQTPDIARARRVLNRLDQRHGRQTDDRLRPFATLTLGQKAEANLRDAAAMTDKDGTPLVTRESIEEVAKQLPPHLLASPEVVDLVVNSAIGIDRRKGRTPKPPEEPLFLERPGAGGGRRDPALTAEDRRIMTRIGLSEKDITDAQKRLDAPLRSGGIRLE